MLLLQVLNMVLTKGSRRREIDLLGTQKGASAQSVGTPSQALVTFDQGQPKPAQRTRMIMNFETLLTYS